MGYGGLTDGSGFVLDFQDRMADDQGVASAGRFFRSGCNCFPGGVGVGQPGFPFREDSSVCYFPAGQFVADEGVGHEVADAACFQSVCEFPEIPRVQVQQDEGGNDGQQVGCCYFAVFVAFQDSFCKRIEQDTPEVFFAFPPGISGGEGGEGMHEVVFAQLQQ